MVSLDKPLTIKMSTAQETMVRGRVQNKLDEYLATAADTVLCDYVMVMIGNKKTSAQIMNDLEAFLGVDEAREFTTWLWQVLDEVERQSAASAQAHEPPSLSSTTKRREPIRDRSRSPRGAGRRPRSRSRSRSRSRERNKYNKDREGDSWRRSDDRGRGYGVGSRMNGRLGDMEGWKERERSRSRERDESYSTGPRTMASSSEFERDVMRRSQTQPHEGAGRGTRQPISSRLLLSAVQKASTDAQTYAKSAKVPPKPAKQQQRQSQPEEDEEEYQDIEEQFMLYQEDEPEPEPAPAHHRASVKSRLGPLRNTGAGTDAKAKPTTQSAAQKQTLGSLDLRKALENKRRVQVSNESSVSTNGAVSANGAGAKRKQLVETPVEFNVVLHAAEELGVSDDVDLENEGPAYYEEQGEVAAWHHSPYVRGAYRGRGMIRGRGRGAVNPAMAVRGGGVFKAPPRGTVRGAAVVRGRGGRGGPVVAAAFASKKWVKTDGAAAADKAAESEGTPAKGTPPGSAAKTALSRPVVGQLNLDGDLNVVEKRGLYKSVKWVKPGLQTTPEKTSTPSAPQS